MCINMALEVLGGSLSNVGADVDIALSSLCKHRERVVENIRYCIQWLPYKTC